MQGLNNFTSIFTSGSSNMAFLVAMSGFLDGIHPCAIAILIFFVAFLLTLRKTFKNIFFLGLIYILVIFLTYLGIGVGLFSGIMILGRHHFFAELGSWFLIVLGLVQIKEYFFPNLPLRIKMPKLPNKKAKELLEKASLPSVILAAFLVGLCSVPCSGGIYTAITALLASRTTYLSGFLYLLLYNFMFVVPLLILLAFSINPLTLAKIAEFRQKNQKTEKLIMGLMMIALGGGILTFFI